MRDCHAFPLHAEFSGYGSTGDFMKFVFPGRNSACSWRDPITFAGYAGLLYRIWQWSRFAVIHSATRTLPNVQPWQALRFVWRGQNKGQEMRLVLLGVALLLGASDVALAQSCGSRKGQACVTCCQGTGRTLSTCEKYCSADAAGKARGNKRESCLAKAGVSPQEAASVRRSDPRHAVYHACMGS